MRALGPLGEDVAARYLAQQGLLVVDRNWRAVRARCGVAGELDIVALDGDTLVVCEVKARSSRRFGDPAGAVTPAKAARLRRLALAWLRQRRGCLPRERAVVHAVRFDVVGVLAVPGGPTEICHLVGVL